MSVRDVILVLLVVAVWGANFTVIKIGLADMPSMLLAALRYVVVAIPAVLFVPRPNVSLTHLLTYGFTVGVGQFGALFYAMEIGMPASLGSVVMQSQAFFTTLFAYLLLKERLSTTHLAGIGIAATGLVLIGLSMSHADGGGLPLGPLLLTLLAGSSWGLSNIVVRRAVGAAAAKGETVDMLGLVVWSALVPPLPLFALALLLHDGDTVLRALTHWTRAGLFSVAYIGYLSTLFGFGAWSRLLARYPASTVAPFSLLVPVTGLLTAGWVLGERLSPLQWAGSALVGAGLLILTRSTGPSPGPKESPSIKEDESLQQTTQKENEASTNTDS